MRETRPNMNTARASAPTVYFVRSNICCGYMHRTKYNHCNAGRETASVRVVCRNDSKIVMD